MTSKHDQRVVQDERDATVRESVRQADKDLSEALDRSERERAEAEPKRGWWARLKRAAGWE